MNRRTKTDRTRERGGRRRSVAALALVVLLAAGLAAGLLFGLSRGGDGPKTAAIVDQLSLTQPNPDFVAAATDLLQRAGYAVDYYPGERVTVDFYRRLPRMGYDLLVLRVHSGIVTEVDEGTGEETKAEYVSLFTAEPFDDTSYASEVAAGRVGASYYTRDGPWYFSVGPDFIRYSTWGRFDDTLVIMMGCDGLRSNLTARAFLEKGARAFVSWSQPISADHTDAATLRLLEHLLIEGHDVADAVPRTAAEVGPDPAYGGELRFVER